MTVSIDLGELAAHIGARLEGAAAQQRVSGIASLDRATPEQVSFFSNRAYRHELQNTQAAAVILKEDDRADCPVAVLIMDNPYLGYARAAAWFNPSPPVVAGIHPSAVVDETAIIATSASIGANAVIEAPVQVGEQSVIGPGSWLQTGVIVGQHCRLVAKVSLLTGTCLGDRVLIHPGAVLGADGFGLANDRGVWVKIPQLGGVHIGDDVEIGANTTIDRGALGNTVIEHGVKLDNQIQIAHNVYIGAHTAIAGCVGIAGSTRIGRHCMIAGGVGIVGHIEIVDQVHITGGSVVLQSITQPGVYSSGTPLQTNATWHRNYHRFKQLDEWAKRLHAVEQKTAPLS
jgi:UDP-3-O-[3-hydroxymyristoyl] glucosamine N-acyltransferase